MYVQEQKQKVSFSSSSIFESNQYNTIQSHHISEIEFVVTFVGGIVLFVLELSQPISFMNSPMGPMGLLQGTLIFFGTRAMGFLEDLHENYGISPIFTGVIICMVGVCCGMISIILLTVLATPRSSAEKTD